MKLTNEAKIGFFVTIVIVLLIVLTIKSGNFNIGHEGYHLNVSFQNIDGVSLNTPVMLNGHEVGHVEQINIAYGPDSTMMELLLWIREDAKLRKDARVYVKNLGFLGEKYIGIFTGKEGGEFIKPDTQLVGIEPTDLDLLLSEGKDITIAVKEITQNLNERLEKNKEAIDRIVANVDDSMINIRSVSSRLDQRIAENEDNVDQILANLNSASHNLDLFTMDIQQNPWKLMFKTKEQRVRRIRDYEKLHADEK